MSEATLLISGRDWVWPTALLAGATLLLVVWIYRRTPASGSLRLVCVTLKTLGILALSACLLEPLWSGQRAKPGANFFALVADNSLGMTVKDRGASASRGEQLRQLLLGEDSPWQARLEETFQVRRYLFDSHLQSTRDFSELAFDGRATALGAALRNLADRYRGQPLAGVLLFTDGNATDLPEGAPPSEGLPPVYPVVIGRDGPSRDVSIAKVTVTQTAFEDAPVTIQADVLTEGFAGRTLVARLTELTVGGATAVPPTHAPAAALTAGRAEPPPSDPAGRGPEQEQTQRVRRDGEPVAFRFQLRPSRSGVVFYQLRVVPKRELAPTDDPEASSEATLANNLRTVVVDRGRGPYRVLYVAGRPNWEYKFLRRALEEDDQVQLVGLIRIARREPKFEFRGRAGESSNPLFRGFGQTDEETERYDQPVLIRLNTRDEFELRGGFPKTPEELFAYHAVILDDLESAFFTHDQMTLIERFVSERGGGFLMLGGADSFHQGHYERTPIANLLPVYLDPIQGSGPLEDLRLSLTREGMLQPWSRLRATEADEKDRLIAMPPLQVMNRVRDVKPGASVIATARTPRGEDLPALVVQRYGHGRVAALMLGDLWRWGMTDEAHHRDMDKAWRQLVRWLVVDVPARVQLLAQPKPGDPHQAVTLLVRAKDQKFQPLDNAHVELNVRFVTAATDEARDPGVEGPAPDRPVAATASTTLRAAASAGIRLSAEPDAAEAGAYRTLFVPRESGAYLAEATVLDENGAEIGRAEAGWSSDPVAEEFRSLRPNRALLETIAKQTGGEVVEVGELERFVRRLPNRRAPIHEAWARPLWHQPAVFLFALGCFLAEWGLRRTKGLA
jgi:uncharacterized membrane protein